MIDRLKIELKEDPLKDFWMSRYRWGGMIAEPEPSYPLRNFRTGKTVYLCKSEMNDRDTVADFLPQDAGILGLYNTLVDEGRSPVEAMRAALALQVEGPK